MNRWLIRWSSTLLQVNKTQNYYFHRRTIVQTNHPSLFFNGTVVPKVNEQKHLGLILDSKLSFERHINEKIIKAKQGIGIINYLSQFLPLKTLAQMCKALVLSHLAYCHTIDHVPALTSQINLGLTLNSLMEKVEKTQYQAITGATFVFLMDFFLLKNDLHRPFSQDHWHRPLLDMEM